jgi:predicted transcriptional regulator
VPLQFQWDDNHTTNRAVVEKKNMSTTDYVKKFKKAIMKRFHEVNADKGHVLPQAWLTPFLAKSSAKLQVFFEQAMQQLQEENLIEYQKKGENHHHIMLTQQGEDYLYPNFSVTNAKEKIQNKILAKFKTKQDKTLTLRWLNAYFGKLNPKEQRIFNDVTENMIAKQLMITGFAGLLFHVTEKGEKLIGDIV